MIVLRVLHKIFLWPHYSGAPGARGPRFIELPVMNPGSYATEVTYRAISDYFLKLNVAFFSHWRLEAHIPLHCYHEYWWGHSH